MVRFYISNFLWQFQALLKRHVFLKHRQKTQFEDSVLRQNNLDRILRKYFLLWSPVVWYFGCVVRLRFRWVFRFSIGWSIKNFDHFLTKSELRIRYQSSQWAMILSRIWIWFWAEFSLRGTVKNSPSLLMQWLYCLWVIFLKSHFIFPWRE